MAQYYTKLVQKGFYSLQIWKLISSKKRTAQDYLNCAPGSQSLNSLSATADPLMMQPVTRLNQVRSQAQVFWAQSENYNQLNNTTRNVGERASHHHQDQNQNQNYDINLQALTQLYTRNDIGMGLKNSSGSNSSLVPRNYRVDPNIETLGVVAGKIIQHSSIPSAGDAPSGSDQNRPIGSPSNGANNTTDRNNQTFIHTKETNSSQGANEVQALQVQTNEQVSAQSCQLKQRAPTVLLEGTNMLLIESGGVYSDDKNNNNNSNHMNSQNNYSGSGQTTQSPKSTYNNV